MFKTSLKVLLLLAPSLVLGQDLAANATADAGQAANATADASQDSIQTAQDQVDWAALEQLVQGGFCTQNATMEEYLSNSTNQYLLPQEYRPFYDELGLDFSGLQALNQSAGENFMDWNATSLRSLLDYYVQYHNAVASRLEGQEAAGQNFSAAGNWNATMID